MIIKIKIKNKRWEMSYVLVTRDEMIFYVGNGLKLNWLKLRFCNGIKISWL
jgi:hypothetical protein